MAIFDEIVRTHVGPRRQNEASFDYLNTSARPGIRAIRGLVESWFEHMPDRGRPDVSGRFRSRDEVQHQSAFFELFWHELLRRNGYGVEIHPAMPNANTNPDFLAIRDGIPRFYLEATLAIAAAEDQAAQRRIAELHDTLDRMDSPDYFLDIQYRGSPQGNVRGRILRARLERWLRELDFKEISRLYAARRYSEVPSYTWPENEFILTFSPIPKSDESRGHPGVRPVGLVMPMDLHQLCTHDDIRVSIEGKATKYGDIDLPLIVAVNVMGDFCDDADTLNALFGEEQLVAIRQADGQYREEWGARVPNGAWRGRAGPRNGLVSAAVIVHRLLPSNLRDRRVELLHNPWAVHALPQNSLALPQRSVRLPEGGIDYHDGRSAGEILGIPDPWPVPD